MAKRRRRKKRRKGIVKIKSSATIAPKDSVKVDTVPRMQARPPADVAPVFKIKIKKKNG